MEKMVFKNEILNIVFGSLLIIFAFVGYFTKIVEDYLPIIVAIVIILLSAKDCFTRGSENISASQALCCHEPIILFMLSVAIEG